LSKLRIKKRDKTVEKKMETVEEHQKRLEGFGGNFEVLMVTPVPMLDHKIIAPLSNFLSGAAARRIGLPKTMDSRNPENARNAMIQEFLHNPDFAHHTHILFVDADTAPIDPYAIEKLLSADKPVISGITPIAYKPKTQMGMFWNVRVEGKDRNIWISEVPEKELFKAEYVGASFLLIRRDVLEKLSKPYMKTEYDFEQIQFVKGEDYYLCEKIRNAGFDIWIDPEVQCHHWHSMDMLEMILMISRYAAQSDDGSTQGLLDKIEEQGKEIEKLKKLLEEHKAA
jgi:hypothetical protein